MVGERVQQKNGPVNDGGATFLQDLADRIGARVRVSTVFGDPIDRDGVTIVPVARARWGFGGGSGHDDESGQGKSGSGGGGGMMVSPVGYIEVKGGSSTYRPIVNPPFAPIMLVVGILLGLFIARVAGRTKAARAREPGLPPLDTLSPA